MNEYENMTRRELRANVHEKLGINENPRSKFRKKTLNSIYAALTGDFYTQPSVVYVPGTATRQEIKDAVCVKLGIRDSEGRLLSKAELVELNRRLENDKREWAGETARL